MHTTTDTPRDIATEPNHGTAYGLNFGLPPVPVTLAHRTGDRRRFTDASQHATVYVACLVGVCRQHELHPMLDVAANGRRKLFYRPFKVTRPSEYAGPWFAIYAY
jgi:hypothetical protein